MFSAWSDLSALFLKLAFISVIFALLRVLTWLPSLFGKVRMYHRGTDVNEISLTDSFDSILNIDTDSFFELYKKNMHDADSVAALLPVVLYAIASGNNDAADILSILTNKDVEKLDVSGELLNIRKQIEGKVHVALSYYTCATPDNGYQIQGTPVTRIKSTGISDDESDGKTLYIACSGSGSYRPVKVKMISGKGIKKSDNKYIKELNAKENIWIIDEFSSTLVNVKNV